MSDSSERLSHLLMGKVSTFRGGGIQIITIVPTVTFTPTMSCDAVAHRSTDLLLRVDDENTDDDGVVLPHINGQIGYNPNDGMYTRRVYHAVVNITDEEASIVFSNGTRLF